MMGPMRFDNTNMHLNMDSCEQDNVADTGKPSKEEYEAAKLSMKTFSDCIVYVSKRREQLIDELAQTQEDLKMYRKAHQDNRDIVRRYEIYEELEKEKECKITPV